MSIQSEIDRINQAKTDLATAIESKGVTVPPNTTINVYPSLVQQIEQGAGLPTGGTPGQMLYQGESGPEWGDKPVMYVTITGDEESGYSADKTVDELITAYNEGYALFAVMSEQNQPSNIVSLYMVTDIASVKNVQFVGPTGSLLVFVHSGGVEVITDGMIYASRVHFTPGATGLTSDNVQDAIEEVNAKATPKAVSVTLSASGWASNSQTVTVQGVETSGQSVRISPATKTDADNWVAAGVWCSEPTTANQLVFTCDTAPTENININVELQEVQS